MMNVLAGGDRSRLNLQMKKKNGKWNERTENELAMKCWWNDKIKNKMMIQWLDLFFLFFY